MSRSDIKAAITFGSGFAGAYCYGPQVTVKEEQSLIHKYRRPDVRPKVFDAHPFEHDAAQDGQEVGKGNQVPEVPDKGRHGTSGENRTAEEHAGQNEQHGHLHGLHLDRENGGGVR